MKYDKFIFIFVLILASSFWLLTSVNVSALTEAEIQAQEAKWKAELEATEKEIA
ncbi:MAG: hypothetical protein UR80_C0052G0007, partial [Parcubacteria group bacterium GW2011_GWB1_35_5]